ncbi:MAG: polysaccharide deacetylase family protein [Rhodothermales bacterium]|nr:polysaccharide deacetylase family protein [Rhodothermales bacterium]
MSRCYALLVAVALVPAALNAQPIRLTPDVDPTSASAYTCPASCVAPNCQCGTTTPTPAIAASEIPQFLVVTAGDCINTSSEALLAPVLFDGSLHNPDGRPLPITYYLSLEGCATGNGTSSAPLVKARYDAGHEIAVHTRTHSTGSSTGATTWTNEITYVKTWLQDAGLNVARDVKGFRAPYLATNNTMFTVLAQQGFLYDASVMESPFYSTVSTGLGGFLWPYTFDYGRAQRCSSWAPGNNCPTSSLPGLWEVPVYEYVSTANPDANPNYYGSMDLGGPQAYSGYPTRFEGQALLDIYAMHFDARYAGNRAPMTLPFHADGFDSEARQRDVRTAIAAMLAHPNVWAVTTTGLIEWMQNPMPASQMVAWMNAYCQRHPCSAPAATASDDDAPAAAQDVRVFPNPARGSFAVSATLATPGPATVEVLDVLGRTVRQAEGTGRFQATFSTDGLAPGMYLVRVIDAAGRASAPQRLVVR